MSFITKRERVFNEYDLFDLPARNEGKLKAYASCTDARAWSHFCTDKAEHLVEIIKRNNDTGRPKYVPTEVIVDTLMVAKNAEIARLKHRIEEFEQMLAAYDQLDLTCDQKCEIANAHAAIKAANKELDELCLDLDLSGFTEGIDSEAFETGKSRGDEPARNKIDETARSKELEWSFEKEPAPKMDTKSNQVTLSCPCDASTLAIDPRIEEMQETIISKDAKLSAMQNTIAVMENDVCEPYCIYAHIYTALEKIFAVLSQNDKYKQYLNLLTAGKDTQCIDLTGKILFKLKVLEKFALALIAPCSESFKTQSQDCSCYRAQIVAHVETTFALTSAESNQPSLDNKRAQLVADIMENDEMKEILSKESCNEKLKEEHIDNLEKDNYSINAENLKRLKNLQQAFDELITCYETLKHEKDCLQIRCKRYEVLEKELESLRTQLLEYNTLWNEKEHYRKRSNDLDSLKEKYFMLSEEVSNLEIQLKAETEINNIKSSTIEELRSENVLLEKNLNEAAITFEKKKNALQCRLQESDCKILCQEQQIKSLSLQIDRLLEQDHNKDVFNDRETDSIALLDKVNSLKEQIKNLKDALFCNEEEKQQLQEEFQNNLSIINELKLEIEDWKSTYEKTMQRTDFLERYTESFQDQLHKLKEENEILSQDVQLKTITVENLKQLVTEESQEVQKLTDEIIKSKKESTVNYNMFQDLRKASQSSINSLEDEKNEAIKSLQLSKQESEELLEKLRDCHKKQRDIAVTLEIQNKDYDILNEILSKTKEEKMNLELELASRENNNATLLHEIQRLREINNYIMTNMNSLEMEKNKLKQSYELTKKESEILEEKLISFDNFSKQLSDLKTAHENLIEEKNILENELKNKTFELDTAIRSIQLSQKESAELLNKLEKFDKVKEDYKNIKGLYNEIMNEKQILQNELSKKNEEIQKLNQAKNDLNIQNVILLQKSVDIDSLQNELAQIKTIYEELLSDKITTESSNLELKKNIDNLNQTLLNKINENQDLKEQIKTIKAQQESANNNIQYLQNENLAVHKTLDVIKKESAELMDKVNYHERLEREFDELKEAHSQIKEDRENLLSELNKKIDYLKHMEEKNLELNRLNQNLLIHSEDLEQALINARTELATKPEPIKESYADLIKEIADIKKEKVANQSKIRNLMNKLDESENVISNLSEDILARDDKISILENHINELEHEIKELHFTLQKAVDTGENITDHSFEKIDKSLKTMEAHHSRAAHNMKLELAKLQTENKLLEEKLSTSKLITEETSKSKKDYWSRIINLNNEKEIIVTSIKDLELKAIGDSELSATKCTIEDILNSLAHIQQSIQSHSSKNITLEQTLLKVKTSSQLLLSKADEAKRIVEQKKQKIINEKEEAIKDKLHMEKQFLDLKSELQKQILYDKDVIKDLEAEILNQKLIIEKINSSRQSYISKLKDDMQSVQELYESSIQKITELQDNLQIMSIEKKNYLNIIEKAKNELEEKSKEISVLENELEQLKLKPDTNVSVQVLLLELQKNMGSQTDQEICNYKFEINPKSIDLIDEQRKTTTNELENLLLNKNISHDIISKSTPQSRNEIQVLTANIEPSFNYFRNNYKSYKLKHLTPCRLEHCSISCIDTSLENPETQTVSRLSGALCSESPELTLDQVDIPETSNPTTNLVDIYNKNSIHTNSSKFIDEETNLDSPDNKSSSLMNNRLEIISKVDFNGKNDAFLDSPSPVSTDKDLFVIYRDSDNTNINDMLKDEPPSIRDQSNNTCADALNVHNPKKSKMKEYSKKIASTILGDSVISLKDEDRQESKNKPRLNINIPRVESQSPTIITVSDSDKKSVDSFTLSIYHPSKRVSKSDTKINKDIENNINSIPSTLSISNDDSDKKYKTSYESSETNTFTANIKDFSENNIEYKEKQGNVKYNSAILPKVSRKTRGHALKNQNSSHHKLSRTGAGALFEKYEKQVSPIDKSEISNNMTPESFGFKYISDVLQCDTDLNSIEIHESPIEVSKKRSDEAFDQIIFMEKSNNPSEFEHFKISSTDYSSFNKKSKEKLKDCQMKTFKEQSIMVDIHIGEDYEKKIVNLTKTLENIEKDYKQKIEAIKTQYDNNIKFIINEHNHGVNSIQSLHEETLHDISKIHENEVENLRTISIEAMRKVEKLHKENKNLKLKIHDCKSPCLEEEPLKMSTPELKKRKKLRDCKTLTKTNVEAFNVKPKSRFVGPCTCSSDINISDTIRNIFEQVDVEQRKMAEDTYLKYIANKMLTSNVETLDTQELSFLHLKVCKIWKLKQTKEETLQKRIGVLEHELMYKQRNAQQHIAELDRKVAEERRRLQEVREAVCRSSSPDTRTTKPEFALSAQPQPLPAINKQLFCHCDSSACNVEVSERRSAGDLTQASITEVRSRRMRGESHRAVLANLDFEETRKKKLSTDEFPTRLRKSHDRYTRPNKK